MLETEQTSLIGLSAAKLCCFLLNSTEKKFFCPLPASHAEFC